jgi:DNA-binding LacI/PurR family transcriptional regulator
MVYGVATPELALDRFEPYQASLEAAGLPFNPALVAYGGPTLEDGYQSALRLLKVSPRPTAIIGINDLMAIGVLRAAGDLGLSVPVDLSLASFDDIPVAQYLVPRLTTATKDAVRLGKEAVRLVLNRIQNPGQPRQKIYVPARLILRESTGPAPSDA